MEFVHQFTVNASREAVAAFHGNTLTLKKLTPLPIIAQIHSNEPLGEGSKAEFTLWFGPFPVRWLAVHSNVSQDGFTDTQLRGPLKSWRHAHRFEAINDEQTHVTDMIVYEHHMGLKGVISRLLFNKPGLNLLFAARKFLTRRGVARLSSGAAARIFK